MTDETPDLELFKRNIGRRASELNVLLKSLQPNIPAVLPEPYGSKTIRGVSGFLFRERRRIAPDKIVSRTFNGKIWVCLIPAKEK